LPFAADWPLIFIFIFMDNSTKTFARGG
jgi:hypothetical protein